MTHPDTVATENEGEVERAEDTRLVKYVPIIIQRETAPAGSIDQGDLGQGQDPAVEVVKDTMKEEKKTK